MLINSDCCLSFSQLGLQLGLWFNITGEKMVWVSFQLGNMYMEENLNPKHTSWVIVLFVDSKINLQPLVNIYLLQRRNNFIRLVAVGSFWSKSQGGKYSPLLLSINVQGTMKRAFMSYLYKMRLDIHQVMRLYCKMKNWGGGCIHFHLALSAKCPLQIWIYLLKFVPF